MKQRLLLYEHCCQNFKKKKKNRAEFDKYIFSTFLLKQGKQTYGDIC